MATGTISGVAPTVTSAIVPAQTGSTSSASSSTVPGIADNFQTFLTLLTTQLKNQNPLDPLDTNQFTQQLVQFAQVEQQLKSNDQLTTLVSLQQNAQASNAIAFVGRQVVVDGASTQLSNGSALWSFNAAKPATATVSIANSTGQVAYSGSMAISPGPQQFSWDGRGNDGTQWPDGTYTIAVTGKDASGQTVAISTEVQGTVDSADLTQSPPQLTMGPLTFPLDKVKKIVQPSN